MVIIATQVKFLNGKAQNLPSEIIDGQIYFVLNEDDTGKILFDKVNKRYVMSDANGHLTKKYYRVGEYDIFSNNFVALTPKGFVVPITKPFLLNSPLYMAIAPLIANSEGTISCFYDKHNNLKILDKVKELNEPPYKPLFLRGVVEDGLFKAVEEDAFTSIIPTSADNFCYLYIGEINPVKTEDGNYSYINFNTHHPLYKFIGNSFAVYSPTAVSGIAEKLAHTLTIGEYSFDGSADVTVPTFEGEVEKH